MAYTYYLKWSTTQKWYYGVRYAQGCHPSELMKTYATSSKHVKNYITEHGLPDVVKIARVFENASDARDHENAFLTRTDAKEHPNSLNETNNKAMSRKSCGHSKGKTYEEIYGSLRSAELKESRRQSNKKRNKVEWSLSAREKVSTKYVGSNNPKAKTYFIDGIFFGTQKDAVKYVSDSRNMTPKAARRWILSIRK